MRFPFVLLLAGTWALSTPETRGMFAFYQTKTVPIDRLFTNLQERLPKNTNDFQLTYQLARLHSMAYSTNLTEATVRTNDETHVVFDNPWSDAGVPRNVVLPDNPSARQQAEQHLTNAILLYERAILLLKKSTNINERQWMILPTELGLAWCLDQAGRRNEAIRAYRKALKVAWKMEVTGDFNAKEWVKDVWSNVRAGQNPLHEQRRGHIGPGVCYSEEIIGYLLRILDPVKDAREIADLTKDRQTLASMPRAVTPILIPLGGETDLADLVDPSANVGFDLDGSGWKRQWGWITPKAAWLVYDPERAGHITSGLQMFGNVTFWIFWQDGYEALSALDDNGDGVLSGAELQGLALWQDANSNGVSDPGEVVPVEALGISSISCRRQRHASGILWNPAGVTFKRGTSRPTFDWVAPRGEPALFAPER
jgi:tetratricopeptide (TPR) repeat protein